MYISASPLASPAQLQTVAATVEEVREVDVADDVVYIETNAPVPGHQAERLRGTVVLANMLVSSSPTGPWNQTMSIGPAAAKFKCANPAAHHSADGSVLLLCKTGSRVGPPAASGHYRFAIYKATSWCGPYVFQRLANLSISGEDPYVW